MLCIIRQSVLRASQQALVYNVAPHARGVGKISDFSPVTRYFSETVEDRDITTTHGEQEVVHAASTDIAGDLE